MKNQSNSPNINIDKTKQNRNKKVSKKKEVDKTQNHNSQYQPIDSEDEVVEKDQLSIENLNSENDI
jgi:hypothetical protein